MTGELWRQIEMLFHRAVDLEPSERAKLLRRECAGNELLRAEVESLVAAERGEDRIARAVGEAALSGLPLEAASAREGDRLGPYLLTRQLGEGGMGVVYLARRADDQYRSTVAIKIVRGLLSTDAMVRFRRERQFLADLTHPNVARLLDGGTTPGGLPYVVMEHIEGEPIHEYCDRRRLTIRQRVTLFRKVAKAVEFAHSRFVVHRDIKPTNILVTPDGVPKLLDFGIAKNLDGAGTSTTTSATGSMVRMLTPSYASPEQIQGEAATAATDVYGLGAVLYELLTGCVPHRFRNTTPAELERVICEEAHVPLSQAVELEEGTGGGGRNEIVQRRGTTAKELRRELAGDLDNVVATALRKEPERRYASVERFSDDLRRYLAGLTVTARADEFTYRARKFVGRHRLGVVAAALSVVSLVGFSLVVAFQAARIAEQRDLAEQRRVAAEQVTSFLVDTFRVSDPNESRGNAVTARELLERGAERLESLDDQPAVRASLEDTMGTVYKNLGLYDEAEHLLRSAFETRRDLLGDEHPDVASSLANLADYEFQLGDYVASMSLYRESLDVYRKLEHMESDEAADVLDGIATLLDAEGDYEEAKATYRQALAVRRRLHRGDDVRVASALQNLSATLRTTGEFEEAERLNREALAIRRRCLGDDHLDVAHSLNQLARLLTLKGEHEAALPLAQEGLSIRRKAHRGEPHAEVAASLGNVAGILSSLGRPREALAHRYESFGTLEAILGSRHPYIAASLSSIGQAQLDAGELDRAEASLRRSVDLHRTLFPEGNPDTAYPLTALGSTLLASGRLDEAEAVLREALRLRIDYLPSDHWLLASSRGLLGECLVRRGETEEGSALLRASLRGLESAFGPDDERTRQARERLSTWTTEE